MAASAEELQAMVARFRLDASGTRQAAVATAAPTAKPKLGSHSAKLGRKPLARHAVAAGSGSTAVSHAEAPHDQKEQAGAFEDF
jgi:hypothetical protein